MYMTNQTASSQTEEEKLQQEIKDRSKNKKKSFIKVFKITYHKTCPIYIRQIGWSVWEYLTVIESEIFTAHYILYPKWYKFFLKEPYSKVEKEAILNMLTAAAQATIEIVQEKKEQAKQI